MAFTRGKRAGVDGAEVVGVKVGVGVGDGVGVGIDVAVGKASVVALILAETVASMLGVGTDV